MSTKWTDPTEGQDHSPQRGQTRQDKKKKKNLSKSTKWTDPTKGQDPFHNVDGPNNGQTYLMWTDPTKDQDPNPQS